MMSGGQERDRWWMKMRTMGRIVVDKSNLRYNLPDSVGKTIYRWDYNLDWDP
jgi:hypothetical protein